MPDDAPKTVAPTVAERAALGALLRERERVSRRSDRSLARLDGELRAVLTEAATRLAVDPARLRLTPSGGLVLVPAPEPAGPQLVEPAGAP